jgi:hypothetical protein
MALSFAEHSGVPAVKCEAMDEGMRNTARAL